MDGMLSILVFILKSWESCVSFKQDGEVTGFQIWSFFLSSESRSLYALSENMPLRNAGLRPDPHREETYVQLPWFGLLYLTSHPVGPEIQSPYAIFHIYF